MESTKMKMQTLAVVVLLAVFPSMVLAGGIMNKHNWSAEYIRTLNRNAAVDSADAASYNPAGVMRLPEGKHFNLSFQFVEKNYWHTLGGSRYETDEPSFVPTMFSVYKEKRWAGYFAFTIVGGGGKLVFPNGTATTLSIGQNVIAAATPVYTTIDSMRLEAESLFYGYTFGGAWQLTDELSYSLGARYVKAERDINGRLVLSGGAPATPQTVHYEEKADGIGWIFGLNFAPSDLVNVGFRYESPTNLEFTTGVIRDTVGAVTNNARAYRDLPGLLALGVSYRPRERLRLETDFTLYLNNSADWDWNPTMDGVDNGYDVGMVMEYDCTARLMTSLGFMVTRTGIDPDRMTPEQPELDAFSIALGFRYRLASDQYLNVGIADIDYESDESTTGMGLNKEALNIALGWQSKF